MLFQTALVLVASVLLTGLASAAELPKNLVGLWATAGTEFEGEKLLGGEALYLLPAGKAALVGAPLPVKRCPDGNVCTPVIGIGGSASFDVASGRLSITVGDGQRSQTLEAKFDANAGTISLQTEPNKVARFFRRDTVVPKALEASLNGNP